MSLSRKLLPIVIVMASCHALFAQQDIHRMADAIDRRYNALRTMQAEFTERYSGNGMERAESGTLSLRKPGKMRWEYKDPKPKLFVSDGKVAWFYVPGEKQVRQAQVKKLDDLRTPLRFLLGHTKLEKEFTGLSLAPDVQPLSPEDTMLRGVPASMADRINQVVLEVTSEHRIARLIIDELDGSTTEFRLTQEKDNPPLPDSLFEFKPPAGVEVLQSQELTAP